MDPAAVLDQLGSEVLVEQLQLRVGLAQLLELIVDAELLEQGCDACAEGDRAYDLILIEVGKREGENLVSLCFR